MNKERRKRITDAIRRIEALVQDILDDEVDAYDNIPESFLESDRAIESEEAQENLEAAIDALEEAIVCLEEI